MRPENAKAIAQLEIAVEALNLAINEVQEGKLVDALGIHISSESKRNTARDLGNARDIAHAYLEEMKQDVHQQNLEE